MLLAIGCQPPAGDLEPVTAGAPLEEVPFVDAGHDSGLDFVHWNGMSGEYYFAEMMGGGGALFDADGDGDLDLYLVQGAMLPADGDLSRASFEPRHPQPLTDRLYRNDLERGAGLRFTDVTVGSGLAALRDRRGERSAGGYGMGVAAGDVDNDGRVDLYVTNFGGNRLLRNLGGLRFADVTEAAGVDDRRWSVAAVFFDYDRDGWLDLYVGNYVDFTLGTHKECFDLAGARDYCAPAVYRGESDRLFRNRGDGTFEDVGLLTGVSARPAPGLGAVATDADGDGWLDLYVANDGAPNYLWLNPGAAGGAFREAALLAGCAVDGDGRPQASMGVDAADGDGDGDEDLFMSHLTGESNALFENLGRGAYRDVTSASGLGVPSLELTGFGTAFVDYDQDGRLDLLVVNGAVKTVASLAAAGEAYPLHQRDQLFRNRSDGGAMRFEDVSEAAGPVFARSEVGRGAAFGDVDNDGDADVVVVNNNGPVRLLLNQAGSRRQWIGLRLVDRGRDALGARVDVSPPGRAPLRRRSRTGGSYASASDPRIAVGWENAEGPVAVSVYWLDGSVEAWSGLEQGTYHTLQRGRGEPRATSVSPQRQDSG